MKLAVLSIVCVVIGCMVASCSGVAVISKLGDFWEFADDWSHFPGTAPIFPHRGTRWPRASPSPPAELRAPAVSPQPEVKKRNVRYVTVPVYEVPVEVEIPVEVRRQPKVEALKNMEKMGEDVKKVSRDTRDTEATERRQPAPVVRVVRQDFSGDDSASGEIGFSTGPSPAVQTSQPQIIYDERPRAVSYGGYRGEDDYAAKPARYEFGYVARAAGSGGQYGKSAYDKNDDSYGSAAEFGHRERRNGHNTEGAYFVDLPDGRRQTVEYYVDGDSGFVARVAYSPIGGSYGGRGAAPGGGASSESFENGE